MAATSLKNRTILLTGSAGFIGFHTARRLLDLGARVIGVDNFNSYYDPSLKEERNRILQQYPRFYLNRGDLSDQAFTERIFKGCLIDDVCHLAAQPGVRYSLENPSAYVQSNINAFVNILETMRHNGIKNFVYASSSSVYGNNKKIPFSVDDPVNEPISLYAATKKSNELMAHTYHSLFGINTTGLRFFTVIGPFSRPDMAAMLFADSITNRRPIRVFNAGKMKRDFTYVDDIVDGIILALEKAEGNEIFNLGNNRPIELEYFIGCLEREFGISAIREYAEMSPGDVLETYADIGHTERKLGWRPKTSVEDGVRLFAEWYKDFYGR